MGQTTMGVMYGVKIPNGVRPYDDDAEDGGILEAWHLANEEQRLSSYKLGVTYETQPRLIGYWVLLERGANDEACQTLDVALPLAQIVKLPTLKKAKLEWRKFAAWAKKRNVRLPAAQLWLTRTEVG